MTIFSGTEAHVELRPLTDAERNILYMLTTMYTAEMSRDAVEAAIEREDVERIVKNAHAVAQVEGLLNRIIRTGLVSPVLSTLERCVS